VNILFRCDGSPEIGLGHVVRCLGLADELSIAYGWSVTFAMRKSELGISMVRKSYPVLTPHVDNSRFEYGNWLYDVLKFTNAKVLVLDVRDGLEPRALEKIKTRNILVVDIDDPENKRLKADLVFYPPVPQVKEMSWKSFSGKLFSGWDWVILRKDFFLHEKRASEKKHKVPNVLVTMGGSDPKLMTFKVLKALNKIKNKVFAVTVIIGGGFQEKEDLFKRINSCVFPVEVFVNVGNMARLMKTADLAVCAFGVTAYELAATGVPAIHLCLSKDHVKSSESFARAGIAIGMGLHSQVPISKLSKEIESLMESAKKRRSMEKNGKKLVGVGGAHKIAETILSALQ
jgi:spore coat polysaccharide biosynthesis predicted glycosyltransferase SpsG